MREGAEMVFVSTHSPDFLNGVKLEEIYWLVKRRRFHDPPGGLPTANCFET